MLYLVCSEGYSGDVDLAEEAIRLTRQLAARISDEEVAGLLALMLLHHARRRARTHPHGSLVPLAEQDRSLWNTRLIAEGVDVLQTALTRDRLDEFQAQAAIAALHADARTVESTGTTTWYASPTARWPALTGPLRSASPHWQKSTPPYLATQPPQRPCTSVTVTLRPRHASTPTPPDQRPASPNAITSRTLNVQLRSLISGGR